MNQHADHLRKTKSSFEDSKDMDLQDESLVRLYEGRIEELERENARLKLQQIQVNTAKELYLKIFEDFPALIWRSKLDKECDYFNKTWLEWTGKTLEQEYGVGWTKGIHPEDFDRCLEIYCSHFDRREPFYMEYRLLNKDGEYRWIGDHGRPFYDLDERTFLGYIGSCYDITDTKLYHQKLLKAKRDAVASDKLKSAFLANMSHEIRTPLNGVIGHIDLALANKLDGLYREDNLEGLEIAKNGGQLLLSIIQDILDLSKIEAGQMDLDMEESFSLSDMMSQTDSLAHTMLCQRKKQHVQFVTHVGDNLQDHVKGDKFRLQQIINNLVSNAAKFTERGKIELSIEQSGTMMEFSVRDSGKGIPESHLKTIFEPFRQVEIGDTREHGGTGLGLTICRRLVEMMGGKLTVESKVGQGTTFTFDVPYRQSKEPRSPNNMIGNIENLNLLSLGDKDRPINGKILVAEDDNVSRRLADRMLQRAGYETLLVKNGQEAVEIYQRQHDGIAVVLMDVQMPELDGLNATRVIREIEEEQQFESTPIIALSAGAMKGDYEKGIAAGMTDYLTKPLNRKLVLKTIEEYGGTSISQHHALHD